MSPNLGGKTAVNLERIDDTNAFEFQFDPSLLDRLASIYEELVAPKLDFQALRARGRMPKYRVIACAFT